MNCKKSPDVKKKQYKIGSAVTTCYFNSKFSTLSKLANKRSTVLITDEHVFQSNRQKFNGWNVIVLRAGEEYKIQTTADAIITQLLKMGADRSTLLVGVGGGVVTDLTGYVASIYMRGLSFGFIPTTLLGMVDASIGGKNGVNQLHYKNMIGAIRQPAFLLFDTSFLQTLPAMEWQNGFAEMIKHAICFDRSLFAKLKRHSLYFYQQELLELDALIQRNVQLKMKIVQKDEFEKNQRRLLNFGHTIGHALELKYELSHGQAISLGMVVAAKISAQYFTSTLVDPLRMLLTQYGLPTEANINWKKVLPTLRKDKKKKGSSLNYILIERIGKAVSRTITFKELDQLIKEIN